MRHIRHALYCYIQALTRNSGFEADPSVYTVNIYKCDTDTYIHIFSQIMFTICIKNMCHSVCLSVDKLCPYVHHNKTNKILKKRQTNKWKRQLSIHSTHTKELWLAERLPLNLNIFKSTTACLCFLVLVMCNFSS